MGSYITTVSVLIPHTELVEVSASSPAFSGTSRVLFSRSLQHFITKARDRRALLSLFIELDFYFVS